MTNVFVLFRSRHQTKR